MANDTPSIATLQFEDFPEQHLSVFLVKNVENTSELRELIVTGALIPEAAVMNATLIPDIFILHVAARAALAAQQRNALKTRSLHAEVVFTVAGSKHIGEALMRFGVNESCQHLLLARFNATPEELVTLRGLVKGEAVEVAELPSLGDSALIRKYHKVLDAELTVGSLEDAVVNRIAIRDML